MVLEFVYKGISYPVALFETAGNTFYNASYTGWIKYKDRPLDFSVMFFFQEPRWIFRYNEGEHRSFLSIDEAVRFKLSLRLSYELGEDVDDIFDNSVIKMK